MHILESNHLISRESNDNNIAIQVGVNLRLMPGRKFRTKAAHGKWPKAHWPPAGKHNVKHSANKGHPKQAVHETSPEARWNPAGRRRSKHTSRDTA